MLVYCPLPTELFQALWPPSRFLDLQEVCIECCNVDLQECCDQQLQCQYSNSFTSQITKMIESS